MNELIRKFQNKYPTKEEKIKALQNMDNEQIDALIRASSNIQAKIFYSSFKKKDQGKKDME